jgi:dephospho-CoA kinase
MTPGEPVYNEVVRHFGGEILNPDLSVNRGRLAELAFGKAGNAVASNSSSIKDSRVKELNRIVHPAVIRAQEEWMAEMGRQDKNAVAIVEAALILESGAAEGFDRLIVVTCGEEERFERFAKRQKLSIEDARKEVKRRMAAQLPDAEKIKAADFVIDNSGALSHTREQVERVWKTLMG